MAEIILYLTSCDSDVMRTWLNREPHIAWIVKAGQSGNEYRWRAVDSIEALQAGQYSLWHKAAGPLNIPSGAREVPDALVEDPYAGWTQLLDNDKAQQPWFGAGLPGPYSFTFKPEGRHTPGAIGRSGFHWLGDRYRAIGKPAAPAAKQWWNRLARFIGVQATGIPWPSPESSGRQKAYAFPDAWTEILQGRPYDVNP